MQTWKELPDEVQSSSKQQPIIFFITFFSLFTLMHSQKLNFVQRDIKSHIKYSSIYDGAPSSQPAFTYSKLLIETLEQGVKYVQS